MGYVGRGLSSGQYRKLDSIAGSFNGSTTAFNLQVNSTTVTPSTQNCLISINGVIQEPHTAFSVTGSTITFTEAPPSSGNFFGIVMGEAAFIAGNTVGANELGASAGIAKASKAVVLDGNKSIADLGNVSGSSTSTGSFGRVEVSSVEGTLVTAAQTNVTSVGTIGTGVWNSTFGSTANTLISGSANAANISGSFTITSSSLASKVTTLEGTGTAQGVGTTNSPTFADVTATGTVTAQEFHTEFISASVIYDSGSTRFGDTTDDTHAFTGSLTTSGSSLKIDSVGGYSGSASSTGSFGSTHVMGNLNIGTVTASPSASVVLGSSDASVTVSGSIFPEGDNNHDLGSANYRWRYIYTTDLKLSNEGTGGNSVDGTEGNWTVEEGEEDLFVTNKKSGKKFRIKLEEIE
jgi:hypothetical protein